MNVSPLVSIIVPVYNTHEYLPACLTSICQQTYPRLEIICVNDASPDDSVSIIEQFAQKDPRVKLVTYDRNRGLFHARLAGADVATGDYICFVDSDDTISMDWIRLLVQKAEEEKADMVLANTVQHNGKDYYIENNYASLCFHRPTLVGDAIMDVFMDDEGYDFAWHTVWNKLYSMELWRKARPEYDAIDKHLIMAEDIAYSAVLYYYARRMAFSNHDAYFYFRNEQASTSASISMERIAKHIDDISRVFRFFEAFLKKHGVYERYKDSFERYKDRNFRIHCNILYARGVYDNPKYRDLLLKGFDKTQLELSHPDDFYFYDIRTTWQSNQHFAEKLRGRIRDPKTDVVSFDLFDTLLVRPFLSPDDTFSFLAIRYADHLKRQGVVDFVSKRKDAERICREEIHAADPQIEDCTLTQIYEAFARLYDVSLTVAKRLQNYEEELDMELCRPREGGMDLLRFAQAVGKKVIVTTDTYYERPYLLRLLQANGIDGWDKLFVSSETGKLKGSGNMYKLLQKEYPGKTILHIGDNWQSDYVCAEEQGLEVAFVPNTREIAANIHYDNYTSDAYILHTPRVLTFADIGQVSAQINLNATQAVSMNRMFAKPYPSWNPELRYNANAYFMGNYLLGTQMLGLAAWIYDVCRQNGYRKVVFLARDGYIPLLAFDAMMKGRGLDDVKYDYFRVSRRSMIPVAIGQAHDLAALEEWVAIHKHTPESLMELLSDYFDDKQIISSALEKQEIDPQDHLTDQTLFHKTIAVLNHYFDFDKLDEYNARFSLAVQEVFPKGTVAFDLGYSGRIQSMLCQAAGRPIDVCFLHSSGLSASMLSQKQGFRIYSFLQYTPKITSIVREYFYSETAPSCIGYRFDEGKLAPLYDDSRYGYIERYIQEEMVRGMTDFIADYCGLFGKDDFMFDFRSDEISLPFEQFINDIPEKDLWTFRCCSAEDMLYYNYNAASLYEIWKYNLQHRVGVAAPSEIAIDKASTPIVQTNQFMGLPRWKRALVLFFADHTLFRQKLKRFLHKK